MSFKSFKQFIDEDCGRDAKSLAGDGGAQNQYGRWGQEPVHLGVHRIEDPNVLQRLNAHVGLVNTREYIDPRSALEHIQNALMRLGYQFEYNLDTLPSEQNVYPLRRFGGRQGFLDMDAQVKEDDGIVQTTGEALVLNVEFIQDESSSRYEVMAQIVPASLFGEDEVQPDPIRPNRAGVSSTEGDRDGINMGEGTRPRQRTKVTKVGSKFQVWVWSNKVKDFIRQGQLWATKAQADKDAAVFAKNEEFSFLSRKKNEGVNEDVSRTFAFPTSDARDRAEKLFGFASKTRVTTTDKGKGKFKFTATGSFKGAQLDRIMKSVTQLKGVMAEDSVAGIADKAVRQAIRERASGIDRTFRFKTPVNANGFIKKIAGLSSVAHVASKSAGVISVSATFDSHDKAKKAREISKKFSGTVSEGRDVFKGHQMKIARDTLKMNDVFARVMGGMTKKQAAEFLLKNGNSKDKKEAKLQLQREQINEVVTAHTEFVKSGKNAGSWQIDVNFTGEPGSAERYLKVVKKTKLKAELKKDFGRRGVDRVMVWVKLFGPEQSKKEAELKLLSTLRSTDAKSVRLKFEAKDENEKELERTRKDGKLASAFREQISNDSPVWGY